MVLVFATINDVTISEASPCSTSDFIEISKGHIDCVLVHTRQLAVTAKKQLSICNVVKELNSKCGPVFRKCFKTDDEYKEFLDSQFEAEIRMLASLDLFKAGDLQCELVKRKKEKKPEANQKCSGDEINTLKVRFEECGRNHIVRMTKHIVFGIRDKLFDNVCAGLEAFVDICGDILTDCYSPEDVKESKTLMRKLVNNLRFGSC